MRKHLMIRMNTSSETLLENMEKVAMTMEEMTNEQITTAAKSTKTISELDYIISRIDALQAELWRRSQEMK